MQYKFSKTREEEFALLLSGLQNRLVTVWMWAGSLASLVG